MRPRLYLKPPVVPHQTKGIVILDQARSHYLLRVLRARKGDAIEVFDGTGREWSALVKDTNPKACRIGSLSSIGSHPHAQPEVHLAQALIKGDAMDRLLQKATELGVANVWLLTSEFTQVSAERAEARMTHWRKILISASEQSRRVYLPELHPPIPIKAFLNTHHGPAVFLLQPGSTPLPRDLARQDTTIIVGPEGGWAPSELAAASSHGVALHSLGNLVLRAETTPLAALAAVRHAWGWI